MQIVQLVDFGVLKETLIVSVNEVPNFLLRWPNLVRRAIGVISPESFASCTSRSSHLEFRVLQEMEQHTDRNRVKSRASGEPHCADFWLFGVSVGPRLRNVRSPGSLNKHQKVRSNFERTEKSEPKD